MPKFEKDALVAIGKGRSRIYGFVVQRAGRKYKIFTWDRKLRLADARELHRARPAFLILESNLSPGRQALRTDKQRRGGLFLEEYLRTFGFTVLREKVHSMRDLRFFMDHARSADVGFIYYAGHGSATRLESRKVETALELTSQDLYLPTQSEERVRRMLAKPIPASTREKYVAELENYRFLRESFRNLEGKILMFSACELGKARGIAEHISRISGAKAVIAYDDVIHDHEALAVEPLLFWQLFSFENNRTTAASVVQRLRDERPRLFGQRIPIVCYVGGQRA